MATLARHPQPQEVLEQLAATGFDLAVAQERTHLTKEQLLSILHDDPLTFDKYIAIARLQSIADARALLTIAMDTLIPTLVKMEGKDVARLVTSLLAYIGSADVPRPPPPPPPTPPPSQPATFNVSVQNLIASEHFKGAPPEVQAVLTKLVAASNQ